MQLKTTKTMPKKAAAKKKPTRAPKGKKDKVGKDPNALGLTGPGAEVAQIPELDTTLADYNKKKKKRCDASKEEIPAKELAIATMKKYGDQLRSAHDGVIRYHFEGQTVSLEAAKEKITFSKDDDGNEGD